MPSYKEPSNLVTELWTDIIVRCPRSSYATRRFNPDGLMTQGCGIVLGLDPKCLLAQATQYSKLQPDTTSLISASTSLGSFTLLAHHLFSESNIRPSSLSDSSSALLSATLPLLMMSLTGEGGKRLGIDEGLFWVWWCVEGALREGEEMEDGNIFSLIEVSLHSL